jgi:hypothetical protein
MAYTVSEDKESRNGYGFNIIGEPNQLLVHLEYKQRQDADAAAEQIRAAISKAIWIMSHSQSRADRSGPRGQVHARRYHPRRLPKPSKRPPPCRSRTTKSSKTAPTVALTIAETIPVPRWIPI